MRARLFIARPRLLYDCGNRRPDLHDTFCGLRFRIFFSPGWARADRFD